MKITKIIKLIKIHIEDIRVYTNNAYIYLINQDYNKQKEIVEKILSYVPGGCDEIVGLLNVIEKMEEKRR